jgi:DNA repair exonuclease SbcCD ATPase subunit
MEYENERLRTASEPEPATDPEQLKQMQLEKQKALARASELEAKLAEVEQDFNSRGVRLQTLETQNSELTARLNEAETEAQKSTATYKQDAETYHSTLKLLQDRVQELEGLNTQKDDTIQGHTLDITTLKDDLERARVELEEEKKELGLQIDELRIAGQVGHVSGGVARVMNYFDPRKQSPFTKNAYLMQKAKDMNLCIALQLSSPFEQRPMMLIPKNVSVRECRHLQFKSITNLFASKFSICRRSRPS